MTLIDDLAIAVRTAGGPANQDLASDGTWETVVPVAGTSMLPVLMLPVLMRPATSGRYFTLTAPLAILDGPDVSEVAMALLRRHLDPDRTDGAAYAVVSEEMGDLIVAIHHWVLPSISVAAFSELLVTFARAVRGMWSDLEEMRAGGAPMRSFEPDGRRP